MIIMIAIGFIILILGAHWMVKGATSLAKKYKVSDLAIGLTIVAFGTSAPELVVNAFASLGGSSEIVLGNVIGSNNFNLFIILGLVGMVYPVKVQSTTVWREIPVSLFVTLFFLTLTIDVMGVGVQVISRFDATVLLAGFALFLFYVYKQMKSEEPNSVGYSSRSSIVIWGGIIFGLTGLIAGGQLVVQNSVDLAKNLGISEKVIGMTIIAAGTSLPELITSLVAALKRNSDIAIGNIIGSNIFNVLLVIPISAVVRPIVYNAKFNWDITILLAGTLVLFVAMFTGKKQKLDRWEAALLFLFYVGYTVYLIWSMK